MELEFQDFKNINAKYINEATEKARYNGERNSKFQENYRNCEKK